MGGGRGDGAQRPALRVNEPKETGACSTHESAAKNPLVEKQKYLERAA